MYRNTYPPVDRAVLSPEQAVCQNARSCKPLIIACPATSTKMSHKRSWSTANEAPSTSPGGIQIPNIVSPAQSYHSDHMNTSPKRIRSSTEDSHGPSPTTKAAARTQKSISNGARADSVSKLPGISRKVKACAACRKQKVCKVGATSSVD